MKNILMVEPQFYNIEYAINPYMQSESGVLNQIDKEQALKQWEDLKSVYLKLGFTVDVLPGVKNFPDMVFAANQTFPFWNYAANKPSVILSKMRSEFRKGEVPFFESFFKSKNYELVYLETEGSFEGCGDALVRPHHKEIYGGYGFRTDPIIYDEIELRTGHKVFRLELKNELFYHLDTCFSILDQDTVAIVTEAFSLEGLNIIETQFKRVIAIDLDEALKFFAGNCHCPDAKNVILNKGTKKFIQDLKKHQFQVIEVDTSEFIKSGGSVFCMKQLF